MNRDIEIHEIFTNVLTTDILQQDFQMGESKND
jgi:hypothetical protein